MEPFSRAKFQSAKKIIY